VNGQPAYYLASHKVRPLQIEEVYVFTPKAMWWGCAPAHDRLDSPTRHPTRQGAITARAAAINDRLCPGHTVQNW